MLLLLACTGMLAPERVEPSFLKVELGAGVATGSADAPLPFTASGTSIDVTVQALDVNGQPYPMNGDLTLKVRPGKLDQDALVSVEDGVWSGSIRIKSAFGPTRIWLADEGDEDVTSGRAASHAVGLTPALWFTLPTLAEMQRTTDTETNNLDKEFAEIRVADRRVIVVARETAGFWATDIDDAPGSYNNLYIYTFGRPDDALQPGARLTLLTGNNQEYLATTQLSFPTITVAEGESYTVPDPVEITEQGGCAPETVESLESARVKVQGTIPADFTSDPDLADKYYNYDEWPVQVGNCTLLIISKTSAPDFDPVANAGKAITLYGMMKEIYGDPVVVIVNSADLSL